MLCLVPILTFSNIVDMVSLLGLIPLLFGNLGVAEVLIIAFVILLLFGGKKIPELMRGLGKGVSSFKQGMNDIQNEITKPASTADSGKSAPGDGVQK